MSEGRPRPIGEFDALHCDSEHGWHRVVEGVVVPIGPDDWFTYDDRRAALHGWPRGGRVRFQPAAWIACP